MRPASARPHGDSGNSDDSGFSLQPPLLADNSPTTQRPQSYNSQTRHASPSARVQVTDVGDRTRVVLTPEARVKSWCRRLVSITVLLAAVGFLVKLWFFLPERYHTEFLTYGTIPIVAALVGWSTNALAIRMTFYPLEFKGCWPHVQISGLPLCGWQGIIPASCEAMARQAVELMTTRLMDVDSVFSKLDPERVMAELRPALEAVVPNIVKTIAMEYFARVWANLPDVARNEITQKALNDSSKAITDMLKDSTDDTASVIDLSETIVDLFTRDKQLMNDIFEKCAEYEFWFIRVSGFSFGFLFGLVQMWLWYIYPAAWVLPVAGFVVGYLTNFIALKIIFLPTEPRKCCIFKCHGLFLKRKKEVAIVYAELFSTKILTAENLLMGIITGPGSDKLFEQLDQSISEGIDSGVRSKRVAKWAIGSDNYNSMKARVGELIRADAQVLVKHLTPYLDEAFDVRTTLEQSMCALSNREFADMLHPVFEEGEWKLSLIGGILGVIVGFLQGWAQGLQQ